MAKVDRWAEFKAQMAAVGRQGLHDLQNAVLGPLSGVTEPGTPTQLTQQQISESFEAGRPERQAEPEM